MKLFFNFYLIWKKFYVKIELLKNILFHLHFLLETWTFKIVENPAIVEKIQLLELSAIAGFYCISLGFLRVPLDSLCLSSKEF